RALANGSQIQTGTQRSAYQPLDLVRAPANPASDRFASGARGTRAGQHGVLGGEPSLAAARQPSGHLLFDTHGAEHTGVAKFDEGGPFGMAEVVYSQMNGAQLVVSTSINAPFGRWHRQGSWHFIRLERLAPLERSEPVHRHSCTP